MSPCYKFDKLFSICRKFNKSNSLDLVDYECINNIDTWVIENEPPPEAELNLEELKNMVAQVEREWQEHRECVTPRPAGQAYDNLRDNTRKDEQRLTLELPQDI